MTKNLRKKSGKRKKRKENFHQNINTIVNSVIAFVGVAGILWGMYAFYFKEKWEPTQKAKQQLTNTFKSVVTALQDRGNISKKYQGKLKTNKQKNLFHKDLSDNNDKLNELSASLERLGSDIYSTGHTEAHDRLACLIRYTRNISHSPYQVPSIKEGKYWDYVEIRFKNAVQKRFDKNNPLRKLGHEKYDKQLRCAGPEPLYQGNKK